MSFASFTGLLLGIIDIAIDVAILLLVGAVIVWLLGVVDVSVPEQVRRIYLVLVALVAIYLIVSLLFGMPVPGPFRASALARHVA